MSPGNQETPLKDKIQEALKVALKRQQGVEVSTLRLLLSAIKYAEIAQQKPADDNKVLDVIAGEVRRHRESIEAFKKGNRGDLVAQEEAELAVLMSYLPKQIGREEVAVGLRAGIHFIFTRPYVPLRIGLGLCYICINLSGISPWHDHLGFSRYCFMYGKCE